MGQPSKRELARGLRRDMTPAEALLWARLRDDRLCGLHFRRQHVIAGLIADFYCHATRLVVEVDGAVHERLVESDATRDEILRSNGFRVLHIPNAEVKQNIEQTLDRILAACQERT